MSWPTRYLNYNRYYLLYRILYYRFYPYPYPRPRYPRRLRNLDFSFHYVLYILIRLVGSRYIRLLISGK
jgi:hypothetical protein